MRMILTTILAALLLPQLSVQKYVTGQPVLAPVWWPTPRPWKRCAILRWYVAGSDRVVLLECVGQKHPFVLVNIDQRNRVLARAKAVIP